MSRRENKAEQKREFFQLQKNVENQKSRSSPGRRLSHSQRAIRILDTHLRTSNEKRVTKAKERNFGKPRMTENVLFPPSFATAFLLPLSNSGKAVQYCRKNTARHYQCANCASIPDKLLCSAYLLKELLQFEPASYPIELPLCMPCRSRFICSSAIFFEGDLASFQTSVIVA